MPEAKDIRILLVDDDHQLLRLNNFHLKKMGFQKIIATDDANKALQLLNTESVDLIISDWHMPGLEGPEFYRQIKSNPKTKNIFFLMMSSEKQKEKVVEAMKLGITHYIFKPFSPEQFELIVKDMLNLPH